MKEYFGSFNYRRDDGKPIYDPPDLEKTQLCPLTVDGVAIEGAWYANTSEGIVMAYCDPSGNTTAMPKALAPEEISVLSEDVTPIILDFSESEDAEIQQRRRVLLSKVIHGHVQIWGEE